MSDWTKAGDVAVIPYSEITHPGLVAGVALNVADVDAVQLNLFHAIIEDTPNTNPGTFYIQANPSATDEDLWGDLFPITVSSGDPDTANLDGGGEAEEDTVIGVSATTGMVAGASIFIRDTNTPEDSEWQLIGQVNTGDSIIIPHGLARAKDDADDTWTLAQTWSFMVDTHAMMRLKVIFIHQGATGANCAIKATASEATDFE